jgi:hypothetical protein
MSRRAPLDTRLLARSLLIVVAVAAFAGTCVAIQPPDDLTQLPTQPAELRLGPRAAEAAQRCRDALERERPTLDANSIVVLRVAPLAGDPDPGALQVEASFRESEVGGIRRIRHVRCSLSSAGLRRVEVTEPGD